MLHAALLFLAALVTAPAAMATQTSATPPHSDSAAGVWLHANKRIQIEIAPCGERLCARIVWLKKPNNAEGLPLSDVKNPDATLRGRHVLGLQVLSGMRATGPDSWADGTIYNPDDGSAYQATMVLKGDGALRIHAYVLVSLLGKTLVWTRVR